MLLPALRQLSAASSAVREISFSNFVPHSSHLYSKMGIRRSVAIAVSNAIVPTAISRARARPSSGCSTPEKPGRSRLRSGLARKSDAAASSVATRSVSSACYSRETTMEVIADYQDVCGECPVWDPETGTLYWTDNSGHRFYRYRRPLASTR